jgi:biotin transport system substrate-specific component
MADQSALFDLHRLVWTALMAALVAVGAYLHLNIGPVPISLQTLFVILAGFVLGPKHGTMAIGLYLLAGAVGLPVFAGGKGGIGHIFGPTGGFLFGFAVSAWVAGLAVTGRPDAGWIRLTMYGLAASLATFVVGLPWLKLTLGFTWGKTVSVGMLPFLPGMFLKLAAVVLAYRFLARSGLLKRINTP